MTKCIYLPVLPARWLLDRFEIKLYISILRIKLNGYNASRIDPPNRYKYVLWFCSRCDSATYYLVQIDKDISKYTTNSEYSKG